MKIDCFVSLLLVLVFVIIFDLCGAGSMVSVDSTGICWLRSSKDDLNVGLSECGGWPLFVSLVKNWFAINLKSLHLLF